MLGPRVDEGHVLALAHHVRAAIGADGARPHDRDLPAHPHSSGLVACASRAVAAMVHPAAPACQRQPAASSAYSRRRRRIKVVIRPDAAPLRSEEHTSELQSLMRISYAGFCLTKKNTTRTQ